MRGELTNEQRDHDRGRAGHRHPEREVVQEREGDVARADLQRHDVVHQAGDERHRHEEDHDHAVGGEDLVVVVRRQEALVGAERDRLLRAHQQRVGKAAQQHHERQDDVHDADLLVVDRGQPVAPERTPEAEIGNGGDHRDPGHGDACEGHLQDRFVERDVLQGEAPEQQVLQVRVCEHGLKLVRKS
ncbi:hypothetical protein M2440_002272 [Methylorubrum extorquens]|nr:hypothetical protein [Methylorubrum extorquens]